MQSSKEKLQQAYNEIEEEDLEEMVKQVENSDARNKHDESWKLINRITGRKTAKWGIIKGNSREERIIKWYDHFQKLLGKDTHSGGSEDEEVAKVLQDGYAKVNNRGRITFHLMF